MQHLRSQSTSWPPSPQRKHSSSEGFFPSPFVRRLRAFFLVSLPFSFEDKAADVFGRAAGASAATHTLLVAQTVEAAVEGQLGPCGDVAHSEQAHACVPVHRPLEGLAAGLAAVVHEPGVVPLGAGIDDAVLVCGGRVQVGDVVLVRTLDSRHALLVNQLQA